ncbi:MULTISPECIES: hypothetical protein [unclassified Streptomyces]|uniref:hypothetical protein n=1 Tax=unclassified Streptomyces TaxID=2593676 RepID=UPI00386A17EB
MLPPSLEPDLFDGRAWVSLTLRDVRRAVCGLPRVPDTFAETICGPTCGTRAGRPVCGSCSSTSPSPCRSRPTCSGSPTSSPSARTRARACQERAAAEVRCRL